MSDTNTELLEILKTQLASVQKPGAWGRPSGPTIQSVSIPIKVNVPSGELRLYLQFTDVTTPEAIMDLVASLDEQGFPLDVWKPRFDSSRDSNSGGGRWPRSGGGWRK